MYIEKECGKINKEKQESTRIKGRLKLNLIKIKTFKAKNKSKNSSEYFQEGINLTPDQIEINLFPIYPRILSK